MKCKKCGYELIEEKNIHRHFIYPMCHGCRLEEFEMLNLNKTNSHQNKNTELSNPIGSSAKTNRDTNGITGSGDNSLNHGNKNGGEE